MEEIVEVTEKNTNVPHQAIISVTVDIMERLDNGMVTGIPVKRFGKLYTVIGDTYEECEEKLNTFMEKLNGNNSRQRNEGGNDTAETGKPAQ